MSRPRKDEPTPKKAYTTKGIRLLDSPPAMWKGRPTAGMSIKRATAILATFMLGRRYALADPRDGLEFAVGETFHTLASRRRKYIQDSKTCHSPIHVRVAEIIAAGHEPSIYQLDSATEADAFLMFPDGQLVNKQAAGGGPALSLDWTPEWVAILGNVPDWVVAAWRGVCESTVTRHRDSMGIAPFKARKHKK